MNNHQLTETGSKIASHLLAVIAGLALIAIGLLLSVPMVGLPLGIPIGLAGVLICLWGLFGRTAQKGLTWHRRTPERPMSNEAEHEASQVNSRVFISSLVTDHYL